MFTTEDTHKIISLYNKETSIKDIAKLFKCRKDKVSSLLKEKKVHKNLLKVKGTENINDLSIITKENCFLLGLFFGGGSVSGDKIRINTVNYSIVKNILNIFEVENVYRDPYKMSLIMKNKELVSFLNYMDYDFDFIGSLSDDNFLNFIAGAIGVRGGVYIFKPNRFGVVFYGNESCLKILRYHMFSKNKNIGNVSNGYIDNDNYLLNRNSKDNSILKIDIDYGYDLFSSIVNCVDSKFICAKHLDVYNLYKETLKKGKKSDCLISLLQDNISAEDFGEACASLYKDTTIEDEKKSRAVEKLNIFDFSQTSEISEYKACKELDKYSYEDIMKALESNYYYYEVAEKLKVSERQIRYWVRCNHLVKVKIIS